MSSTIHHIIHRFDIFQFFSASFRVHTGLQQIIVSSPQSSIPFTIWAANFLIRAVTLPYWIASQSSETLLLVLTDPSNSGWSSHVGLVPHITLLRPNCIASSPCICRKNAREKSPSHQPAGSIRLGVEPAGVILQSVLISKDQMQHRGWEDTTLAMLGPLTI